METEKIIDRLTGQNWIDQWIDGYVRRSTRMGRTTMPFAQALNEGWDTHIFVSGISTFTWDGTEQGWRVWALRMRYAAYMNDLTR